MDTELYKVRSVSRCIADALTLFTDNFKTIARRTAFPTLFFALFTAITLIVSSFPQLVITHPERFLCLLAVLCLFILASGCWLTAAAMGLLNGQKLPRNIRRTAKMMLIMLAIVLVISVVVAVVAVVLSTGSGETGGMPMVEEPSQMDLMGKVMAATALVCIVCLVLVLPLYYSAMKYLMEPNTQFSSVLGKNYRKGWHHWGFLFGVVFVTSLITSVCSLVIQAPIAILQLIESMNAIGVGMGDASGLPAMFSVLKGPVTFLCTWLCVYVELWALLAVYFAYGTVEAKIRLRENRPESTENPYNPTSSPALPEAERRLLVEEKD